MQLGIWACCTRAFLFLSDPCTAEKGPPTAIQQMVKIYAKIPRVFRHAHAAMMPMFKLFIACFGGLLSDVFTCCLRYLYSCLAPIMIMFARCVGLSPT